MEDKDLSALKALADRFEESGGQLIFVAKQAGIELRSLIARVEQAEAKLATTKAASVDLSGLTRYEPELASKAWDQAEARMEVDAHGDYVKLADVQSLIATAHPSGAAQAAIQAAPMSAYSPADQEFYRFWYGHMKGDIMTGPLADVRHSTARFIWDAAKAANEPDSIDPAELMKRWPTAQAFLEAHPEEYFESNEPVPRLHLAYAVDLLTDALESAPAQAWNGELPEPDAESSATGEQWYSADAVRKAIGAALAGVRDKALEEAAQACSRTGFHYESTPAGCAAIIRSLKLTPADDSHRGSK